MTHCATVYSVLSLLTICAAFAGPSRARFIDRRARHCSRGSAFEALTPAVGDNSDFDTCAPPIADDTPCSELPGGVDFPSLAELEALGPRGAKGGHRIIRQYNVPSAGFDLSALPLAVADQGVIVSRLNITADDVTLPVALALVDPVRYPSLAGARKACRKGSILVRRCDYHTGNHPPEVQPPKPERCWRRGRVGDRVHPGDIIGRQAFTGDFKRRRCYPSITYGQPKFELPVLFEDDHMAIVNKPAGIGIYGHRKSRSGSRSRRTVLAMLPFVLSPPAKGTQGGALRRPAPVHRLDTPTSGLLVVAKTRAALRHLTGSFRNREVIKRYTAIVNGIPQGDDVAGSVPPTNDRTRDWCTIDYPLGGKSAATSWRIVRSARSLNAKDGTLTLVQLALHTGRYHQIRRHMAWVCRRPLVGDALYAGGIQAGHFRRRGLFLCSSGVTLQHPYYNTDAGRRCWDSLDENSSEKHRGGMIQLSKDGLVVELSVRLDVPRRFDKLLSGEEAWANRSMSPLA